MPKQSLIKKLLERRVPQIIGSYFIAGTTAIFFIDWLINRYNFPDYYVSLCLFGLVAIIPTVIIISYFHGAPGKDEWTIVEKTIIPINIIFIIVSLLVGYKYEIWIYGFEEKAMNYIIHLSSNKENIDSYYGDYSEYFDKETHLILEVEEPLLDSLQTNIIAQLNEDYFSYGIIIESTKSQKIKDIFNQLPHYRSSHNPDSLLKIIKKLKREIYESYNFETEHQIIVSIYQVHDKRNKNVRLGYFCDIEFNDNFQHTSDLFSKDTYDKKDLIEAIVRKLSGTIYSNSIGDKNIGRIIDILEQDLVKIGFNNELTLRKGMTLVSPAKYYWQKDGLERRIEDYELATDYINRNPMFLLQDDKNGATAEEKKALYGDDGMFRKDYLWALKKMSMGGKTDRQGVSIWNTIYYGMQILDVNQEMGTLVAKVTWKYPPWVKVRKNDRIYIKGAFGIER